ncbi:LamG-like jellyroll fold domain-containing protein [Bacteroidota bacterium]
MKHTNRLLLITGFLFITSTLYSQIPDSSLIAHWSFDGHVFDSTGNGFHGTSYNVTFREGIIGEAVMFDSSEDEIHFPAKDSIPPSKIGSLEYGSISVWFNYKSIGNTGNILPILYFGESEENSRHNSLIIEIGHGNNPANRKLYFTIINRRFCYDSNVNLKQDTWYHFVAVVSPEGNTGYLNGREMNNRHYNLGSNKTYSDFFADVPTKELLSVGYGRFGQQDSFFHYKGLIDDVRIYNKALSAEEVRALFSLADNDLPVTSDYSIPSYENIAYGPYERNLLDFWKADSEEPTPLVVFIHGGGFINGSKDNAKSSNLDQIEKFLHAGVSYASISYRLRSPDTNRLYDGTRLDTIMHDCARAIQFLKYKANEYNLAFQILHFSYFQNFTTKSI